MEYLSVFSQNGGKYGPEKTPYLDTFHAVMMLIDLWSLHTLVIPELYIDSRNNLQFKQMINLTVR